MALIDTIAKHFGPYLELQCLIGDSYYFRKESTSLRDSSGSKRGSHLRVK